MKSKTKEQIKISKSVISYYGKKRQPRWLSFFCLEARARIELAHNGFADHCFTT